jgi:cation:H+ antiporter
VPAWALPVFVACALVSLLASHRLVKALEALGDRWAVPSVLLGLMAALAADGPELTSALTAQLRGEHTIGLGVLFGSNVFNIAALLGLGAVVAGRVRFRRRAVALEGTVATGVAGASLLLVHHVVPVAASAALAGTFFLPYLVLAAVPVRRLPVPARARSWLALAVSEERDDLQGGYPSDVPGHPGRQVATVLGALVVVVGASALMEQSASVGGAALGLPEVVVGGVVLAAVTSLPNVVAALYLARAGRGAAMLSEAMNSNTMNVVGGLVVPAALVGLVGAGTGVGTQLAAWSYLAMTAGATTAAFARRGVSRPMGWVLLAAYGAYLAGVLAA